MPDRFTFIIALFAVLLAGLALYRTAPPDPEPEPESEAEGEHGELAPHMASLQRFAEKLHLAGQNEHWELAHFYEHEIEEVAGELVAGGFEEDGHEIGPLVERWLMPAVERIGESVEAESAADFEAAYGELVTACNTCHTATEHGFVQIVIPEDNVYPSQDFTP